LAIKSDPQKLKQTKDFVQGSTHRTAELAGAADLKVNLQAAEIKRKVFQAPVEKYWGIRSVSKLENFSLFCSVGRKI
jgi:hypothetical protein